jgi:hypothetical protein
MSTTFKYKWNQTNQFWYEAYDFKNRPMEALQIKSPLKIGVEIENLTKF